LNWTEGNLLIKRCQILALSAFCCPQISQQVVSSNPSYNCSKE
jgi:hypothetical protein